MPFLKPPTPNPGSRIDTKHREDRLATSFDRIDIGNNNGTNATFFVDNLQLTGK